MIKMHDLFILIDIIFCCFFVNQYDKYIENYNVEQIDIFKTIIGDSFKN